MTITLEKFPRIQYWAGKQFRHTVFGYDYLWQAGDIGVGDVRRLDWGTIHVGRLYLCCKPIKRFPGSKRGRLRGEQIFMEDLLPAIPTIPK